MDEILAHLRKAEEHATEDNPDAWYELAKAKMAFATQKRIWRLWHEIDQTQEKFSCINTSSAAHWLVLAEYDSAHNELLKHPAIYCILRTQYSLAKAKEFSAEIEKNSAIALAIASCCIIALLAIFWQFFPAPQSTTQTLLHVPLYVVMWGFLGGIAWCLYTAAYWAKRRLFDRYYLVWYLSHPWLSAVLGSAVSLIILGGIETFTQSGEPGANNTIQTILLSLIGFTAGFSTDTLWHLLDRTLRRIFNIKSNGHMNQENLIEASFDPST